MAVNKTLFYKQYYGTIEYYAPEDCYEGYILDTEPYYINYFSNTLEGLEKEFRKAVEEYIKNGRQI